MKRSTILRQILFALAFFCSITVSYREAFAQVQVERQEPLTAADSAPIERETRRIHRGEIVVFGQDVHVRENEECREVIVIGGDAIIEGTVRGNVVVVFGDTKVTGTVGRELVTILGSSDLNGKVRGSFVNVLGSPTLGSNSVVEGEAIAVGGSLRLDPGALLQGARREFALGGTYRWLGDWFRKGFLLARPLPPQLSWAWIVASVFLIVYVLMAVLFPRPIRACVSSLDGAPVAAFFVGLFSLILFIPVLLLLAFTIVGVPILVLSLIAAVFFGKVAIYQFTGQQLGRQLRLDGLQLPLVALVLGIAIFYMLYTVPVLGFLFWGVGIVWGVGAVMMAVFSSFKRERTPTPAYVERAGNGPDIHMPGDLGTGIPPTMEGSAAAPGSIGSPDVIRFERAGFWLRAAATIIDLLLVGVFSALLAAPTLPFLLLVYHVGMWTWKGTTIGGIVFGLKIVRLDGRDIEFSVALVRGLFSIISTVFFLLGFFWAGWDREKQSWHDKIAGTVIVKAPKGMSLI